MKYILSTIPQPNTQIGPGTNANDMFWRRIRWNLESFFECYAWWLCIICALILLLFIVAKWKCYIKMGESGWTSIIPIYSNWIVCKHVFNHQLVFLLLFVPIIGHIFIIFTYCKLFNRFGKSKLFCYVLGILATPIAFAVCAFDDSIYT